MPMEEYRDIPKNPREWRYTWEAQPHSPNLRLVLFDSGVNPRLQCENLNAHLILAQSLLLVSWIDRKDGVGKIERQKVCLTVPIPRVLIDAESTINFRAFDDHIEAKLVLLLPIDHPVVCGFDKLNSPEGGDSSELDMKKPLVMDYDSKCLSSSGGVHFYCRGCSARLTKDPLRNFLEMPSVNWREVADNWFGTCCCSFGGISETLVSKYVDSHTCAKGVCLLSHTTVTLNEDDLEEFRKVPESNGIPEHQDKPFLALNEALSKVKLDFESSLEKDTGLDDQSKDTHNFKHDHMEKKCTENIIDRVNGEGNDHLINETLASECCNHGTHDTSESSPVDQMNVAQLAPDKKFLLNGLLEDVFMARPSNLSRNVEWIEFTCYNCSCLLGSYPSGSGKTAINSGVQLFKCYISTSLPTGGSGDLFRKYCLERMFANQLVESAKDELSFRIVVNDLTTKSPMLQVILLNPSTWSCTGFCSTGNHSTKPAPKAELFPVVKVLFSEFSGSTESQLGLLGSGGMKHSADEVFILRSQAEKLINSLASAHELLPPSCAYLQDLPVSSMRL